MFDLQALAFQADITRVFSMIMSRELSTRTFAHIGVPEQHHAVSHHRNDPAMPGRCRLGCRKTPPTALVKHRSQRLEALAYGRFVNHAKTI